MAASPAREPEIPEERPGTVGHRPEEEPARVVRRTPAGARTPAACRRVRRATRAPVPGAPARVARRGTPDRFPRVFRPFQLSHGRAPTHNGRAACPPTPRSFRSPYGCKVRGTRTSFTT